VNATTPIPNSSSAVGGTRGNDDGAVGREDSDNRDQGQRRSIISSIRYVTSSIQRYKF